MEGSAGRANTTDVDRKMRCECAAERVPRDGHRLVAVLAQLLDAIRQQDAKRLLCLGLLGIESVDEARVGVHLGVLPLRKDLGRDFRIRVKPIRDVGFRPTESDDDSVRGVRHKALGVLFGSVVDIDSSQSLGFQVLANVILVLSNFVFFGVAISQGGETSHAQRTVRAEFEHRRFRHERRRHCSVILSTSLFTLFTWERRPCTPSILDLSTDSD
mmetsp:Transcript_30601/g.60150  ORF Transcript_30601/g.60150 Transcript_30601/m.60150 type:complete len:215 (-) Transcript_30601:33-677(-)